MWLQGLTGGTSVAAGRTVQCPDLGYWIIRIYVCVKIHTAVHWYRSVCCLYVNLKIKFYAVK